MSTESKAEKEARLSKELQEWKDKVMALENNIESSKADLAKIQEHTKSAQTISEKIKNFEQKVIKKEAEVSLKKKKLDDMKKENLQQMLKDAQDELAQLDERKSAKERELQLKEDIIRKYPDKAMAAKKYIAKSGSVGMKIGSLPSNHMLAGRYFVSDVIPAGPIVNAGISLNDVLMKIDNEDVLGKSLDEVAEILKGPPGSSVNLQFYRNHMNGFVKLDATVIRAED